MIELKAKVYKRKAEIPDEICRIFKSPINFYLLNKHDELLVFYTFVILDFSKKEFTYIHSYLPENIEKVKKYKEKILFNLSNFSNPHCSLEINPGEDFYSFMEGAPYFFYVNYKDNIIRIYFAEDVFKSKSATMGEMGATFFKDNEDSNYFYAMVEARNAETGMSSSRFYRISLDLSDIQEVFRTPYASFRFVPHMTRKYKNFLLNSDFFSIDYQNKATGRVYRNREMTYYVYDDLYREYCKEKNMPYSANDFQKNNQISNRGGITSLDHEFKQFYESKGKNLWEICENIPKYAFSALGGRVLSIDLKNNTTSPLYTTFCAPAHFEIDSQEDAIYTSSHNFVRWDRMYYIGPAAIDKFLFRDGKFIRSSSFSHPTGYRFTSHRIFYYENRPYVCTIGHPNRLFIIDARTMEFLYKHDLFGDVLSNKTDMAHFLNYSPKDIQPSFRALEVSSNGEFIFILGNKEVHFFSFSKRKIVASIPYFPEGPFEDGVSLDDFYDRTTHVNYLN